MIDNHLGHSARGFPRHLQKPVLQNGLRETMGRQVQGVQITAVSYKKQLSPYNIDSGIVYTMPQNIL